MYSGGGGQVRREPPEYRHPATTSLDEVLELNPHYSDERFRKDQTVFGQEEKGLNYDYSDRLWQWDYDKAQESSRKATESGARPNTGHWLIAYLTAYYGRPVELKHVIAGVNRSNGYAYNVYGTRFLDEPLTNKSES